MDEKERITDLARTRAITYMSEAILHLQGKHYQDAMVEYGQALAYEEIYDFLRSNQELNSLYRDCPQYKKLCIDWVKAKRYTPIR